MEDIGEIVTQHKEADKKKMAISPSGCCCCFVTAVIMDQENPYPIERPAVTVQSGGAACRLRDPMGRADNAAGVFPVMILQTAALTSGHLASLLPLFVLSSDFFFCCCRRWGGWCDTWANQTMTCLTRGPAPSPLFGKGTVMRSSVDPLPSHFPTDTLKKNKK